MKKIQYYTAIVLQKIGYCLFLVLYKIFVKLEITGRENLKNLSGPIILASNHTSELDATALPMVLPFFSSLSPIYFVMNRKEKFNKNFGWRSRLYGSGILAWFGGYPLDSGHNNYEIALKKHIEFLKEGITLCIFPEGKRTIDGQIGPAHGGLGYLVYTVKATTIPITINTFFNISWQEFFRRKMKVKINIGKPTKFVELLGPDLRDKINEIEDFRRISQMILDKSKEMIN